MRKFTRGDKVSTWWNNSGTSCSSTKDETHTILKTGFVNTSLYNNSKKTVIYRVSTKKWWFLTEEKNLFETFNDI